MARSKHFRNGFVYAPTGAILATRIGPRCECGEPWAPICTKRGCPGREVPMKMIRHERGYDDNRRAGFAGERAR